MHQHNHSSHFLRRRNGWTLWEYWVLATAIGELLGFCLVVALSATVNQIAAFNTHTILLLIGTLEGLVLGFCQWLVLRHYIRHSIWWIVATTAGAFIAWLLGLLVSVIMAIAFVTTTNGIPTAAFLLGVALIGAGVGFVVGFAQWWVLKAHIHNAAWWIVANSLAWSLGLLVAFAGARMVKVDGLKGQTALTGAATGVTMGAVIGAVTGIALVWLFKRHLSKRS